MVLCWWIMCQVPYWIWMNRATGITQRAFYRTFIKTSALQMKTFLFTVLNVFIFFTKIRKLGRFHESTIDNQNTIFIHPKSLLHRFIIHLKNITLTPKLIKRQVHLQQFTNTGGRMPGNTWDIISNAAEPKSSVFPNMFSKCYRTPPNVFHVERKLKWKAQGETCTQPCP